MIILMDGNATAEETDAVVDKIGSYGFTAKPIAGRGRVAIAILHNSQPIDADQFQDLPGVSRVVPVSKPYKLVSREAKPEDTIIPFDGAQVGRGHFVVMAGPCAVEDESQALAIAHSVRAAGATFFRGGILKPRTSPYSFQGIGSKGIQILMKVREETGLLIITEAIDVESLELLAECVDIIQIGSRNMQNFTLLRRAGEQKRPVLLKRGMSATVEEWLMAAEYIMAAGNSQVVLCERGVRTFADHARNLLDLAIIPAIRELSHLPIIVDPSHAAGRRLLVPPLARAAVAAGCDGLLVEVHHDPDRALSDGAQCLYPDQFAKLMEDIQSMRPGSWS